MTRIITLLYLIIITPNIIIAERRGDYSNIDFSFFDFSYVAIPVCILGIIFISLIGTRLISHIKRKVEHKPLI